LADFDEMAAPVLARAPSSDVKGAEGGKVKEDLSRMEGAYGAALIGESFGSAAAAGACAGLG
jgi:hypothetical protein